MNASLMGVEPGQELMYYAAHGRSFYREAPQLVRKVVVKRTTKTQIVIAALRGAGEGAELRFYKDGGHIVGGGYNSEQLRPLTEETLHDERASKLRREVYAATEAMEKLARMLSDERVPHGPIEVVQQVGPQLRDIHQRMEQVLAVLKSKEPG